MAKSYPFIFKFGISFSQLSEQLQSLQLDNRTWMGHSKETWGAARKGLTAVIASILHYIAVSKYESPNHTPVKSENDLFDLTI